MTLLLHELKQNKISIIIWSAVISFMLGVCIIIYPEMSSQMVEINDMFADMGSFSAAFGVDKLNFGEFLGYFSIECGNVLGIGGAFFAAILGISALAKEEKEHTAEFLLSHPISRTHIITQKLISVIVQIVIMNLIVSIVTSISIISIGEKVEWAKVLLLLLSYLLLQLEIASITFGISAFIRRGGIGIGLGIAVIFYFMNIIANLTEDLKPLKYITPFGYTEGADIIANTALKGEYLAIGAIFTIVGLCSAYLKYTKKDIT